MPMTLNNISNVRKNMHGVNCCIKEGILPSWKGSNLTKIGPTGPQPQDPGDVISTPDLGMSFLYGPLAEKYPA